MAAATGRRTDDDNNYSALLTRVCINKNINKGKMMLLRVTNQALLYIFDEHEGSAKKIAKALNLDRKNVQGALFRLKKDRLVESSGYGRYRPKEEPVEDLSVPSEDCFYPEAIDWAREYIILANKIADSLKREA